MLENNKRKRLFANSLSSVIYQITTIVCGFILPRTILQSYGSNVNGLVNSITQFLNIISFLELGVGRVIQSSLYKPLLEKNEDETSKIISSANKFFRTIALILVVYVLIIICFFKVLINKEFSFLYTSSLIITISISLFAQYYFGIVNRLLLTADQKGYIQYTAQIIATLLNTFICISLIKMGFSIQVVKLTTSIIYLIQPFVINIYIKKNYRINKRIEYDIEPIKQKWNGIAQHVAAVILDNSDIVVLTLFASLSDISIYSVYYLVIKGVKQLLVALTNDITSLMGECWAGEDLEKMKNVFLKTEWFIHTFSVLLFSITAITIVQFIQIYTFGINDANYYQPLFSILLIIANAMHCIRLPYNITIFAAGHYKQTQNNYILASIINVAVSVILVRKIGLIGVAIGTSVAMIYQTFWMAYYDIKNIIKSSYVNCLKQFCVDLLTVLVVTFVYNANSHTVCSSYIEWIVFAIKNGLIVLFISILINYVFYPNFIKK